jgi:hypothetical protein
MVGGSIIEPMIGEPDYLSTVADSRAQVTLGVLLELVNGICVVGIAVMLFPILKKHGETLALGYVAARILEAVVIIVAAVGPLTMVALSQKYIVMSAPDAVAMQAVGTALVVERTLWVSQMLAIAFGLAALPFYTLLYRSKLLPRFVPVWGFVAVVSVLAWNLLELFGISVSFGMVLAVPMILNEIFLAIWLIVKGFNPSALAPESGRAPAN